MKPLSKKIRLRVLCALFFIFLVCTPLLIGYSRGYRIDDALGIIQTGGIYIHSEVANTFVYLDDDFVENNGALFRSTLIESLLPNRYYTIRVEHPDFQSWIKVLRVKPKFVTEARVIMLPKKFEWITIPATTTLSIMNEDILDTGAISKEATSTKNVTKDVSNPEFLELQEYFLEDRDQFAVEVATSTYEYIRGVRHPTTTTVTEIRLPSWFSDNASTTLLTEKQMVREREGVITWLDDGKVFAVWGKKESTIPYYFCVELCKEQLVIHWDEPIIRYEFYPNRSDVLIVLNKRGIYAVELDNRSQRNIQTILEEPNLDFRLESNGTIIVFDGMSFRKTNW